MLFLNKYSTDLPNSFDWSRPFKSIQFGVVIKTGKVDVNNLDQSSRKKDKRFNSDEHIIRCRILGSNYDNAVNDDKLANCHPLMPKHTNVVPKEGEVVLVFTLGEDEKQNDRFYIGPIISSVSKLKEDVGIGTALSNFNDGFVANDVEIDRIPEANGIYENPQNVIIDGRNNTDIVQRDNEILIRSGKFVINQPLKFNNINPAYIQLKYNQPITDPETENVKNISVSNIVANKINLLTYADGNPEFENLTFVDTETNKASYISDDQLNTILEEAHPLVFGDTLVEYLQLLKNAFFNHVHNNFGATPPTDRVDEGSRPVNEFDKNAERLESLMLSKNIRIN
jgi:hypothetical protein